MAKSTYQNLITIPTSGTDTVSDGSTIGGDIVANMKKLADQIHPDGEYCAAVMIAGGQNVFNDSTNLNPLESGKYVVNNNIVGNVTGYGPAESVDSSGSYVAGQGSGAFMKGVLILNTSENVMLLDVPYAGGIIVRYDLLASDGITIYTDSGTMCVFDIGIDGSSEKVTSLGTFTVNSGDLYFTPVTNFGCLQVGLHGTILSGSYNLVSGQSSSYEYGNDYSS